MEDSENILTKVVPVHEFQYSPIYIDVSAIHNSHAINLACWCTKAERPSLRKH